MLQIIYFRQESNPRSCVPTGMAGLLQKARLNRGAVVMNF